MNILLGSFVIAVCTLGLSYLIGFAVIDRDDESIIKQFYYCVKIGMIYIGYVSLVVVFIVGLIFGFDLLF